MRTTFRLMSGVLVILFSCSFLTNAQNSLDKIAIDQWFNDGTFLRGWKVMPFEGTNRLAFYQQYQSNKELLDKAFAYLKNTNLDTISLGKHSIEGDALFAVVTDNPTKTFEDTKWEFHKKYLDIQYVIHGKEKMGIAPVESLNVTTPYSDTKDVGFGESSKSRFYVAQPSVFMIFFPADAHRPNIKEDGCDKTRKIVLKVLVK